MAPLGPEQVVTDPNFLLMGLVTALVMVGVGLVDGFLSRSGGRPAAWAEAIDSHTMRWVGALVRLSLAAFFCVAVLYFGDSPVYLTPELHAAGPWVAKLQVAIAVLLLWRRSAWLGALGIAVLYGWAMATYGWFHLLDYPVFLGAAAFVAIDSLSAGGRLVLALNILRVTAGLTLMWAGAEKWLYPWWSYPMVDQQLSSITMGLTPHAFMVAAGFIEFAAAFALIFGRLAVQLSAVVLLVPFLAAIPAFGAVDAVGHAPVIVVLLVLSLTRNRLPQAVQRLGGGDGAPLRLAGSCLIASLGGVGAYWGLQLLAYGRSVPVEPGIALIAVLLVLPMLCWFLPRPSARSGVGASRGGNAPEGSPAFR